MKNYKKIKSKNKKWRNQRAWCALRQASLTQRQATFMKVFWTSRALKRFSTTSAVTHHHANIQHAKVTQRKSDHKLSNVSQTSPSFISQTRFIFNFHFCAVKRITNMWRQYWLRKQRIYETKHLACLTRSWSKRSEQLLSGGSWLLILKLPTVQGQVQHLA